MRRACRALQEQKASRAPREREVPLESVEPLAWLGQQGQQELWVRREPQVPGDLQDSRVTEVLPETEEPRVKVDFQTVPP